MPINLLFIENNHLPRLLQLNTPASWFVKSRNLPTRILLDFIGERGDGSDVFFLFIIEKKVEALT